MARPWQKLPPHPNVRYRDRGVQYGPGHVDELIRSANSLRASQLGDGSIQPPLMGTPTPPPPELEEPKLSHKGYCVKCRTSVDEVPTEGFVTMDNGAERHYGSCPNCGTAVHTFKKKGSTSGKA